MNAKHLKRIEELTEILSDKEEFVYALIHTFPVPLWVKDYRDDSGRMLAVSLSYGEAFSVDIEEYTGATDYDIWPKETADRYKENDLEVIEHGFVVHKLETVPVEDPRWCNCAIWKWSVNGLVFGMALPMQCTGDHFTG